MFEHFVEAQAGTFERALSELSVGRKQTHWMWFIFPQIIGLGHSAMAQRFALADLVEARHYLVHPLLGPRLLATTSAVMQHRGVLTANAIFGTPDDLKFRSSMTLFRRAAPDELRFQAALKAFFKGEEDDATIRRL